MSSTRHVHCVIIWFHLLLQLPFPSHYSRNTSSDQEKYNWTIFGQEIEQLQPIGSKHQVFCWGLIVDAETLFHTVALDLGYRQYNWFSLPTSANYRYPYNEHKTKDFQTPMLNHTKRFPHTQHSILQKQQYILKNAFSQHDAMWCWIC